MLKDDNKNLFFSKWMLYLGAVGLILNLALANGVVMLGLPLYLDNVGSILVAALGGPLPGVIVGFLSNALSSIGNPISLYYGFLTAIIAGLASLYSRKGVFLKWQRCLLASLSFTAVGGACGSMLTWWLYGGQISGVAAPIAFFFKAHGVDAFFSQLLGDTLLNIPDKLITVAVVATLLHFFPKSLYGKFEYGYLYEKRAADQAASAAPRHKYGHSISIRLTAFTVAAVAVVGVFALFTGAGYYRNLLKVNSESSAQYASSRAAQCVNGDSVPQLMERRIETEEYRLTEKKLHDIYDEISDIRYVYVYVIRAEGCYALYDIDTQEAEGAALGAYVENDPDIYNRLNEFLAGGGVAPGYDNAPFGTQVSAYTPVYNSAGATVAYACADIDQRAYIQKFMVYIVQFASLLFAVALLMLVLLRRYVDKHIKDPIFETIKLTRALDGIRPEEWTSSEVWRRRTPVRTDDELEELYQSVTDAERNVSESVRARMETEQKLMQTEELERINAELEAAIKKADHANQAKTDFLARMSHDMRTPMNGILGLSYIMEDQTDVAEIKKELPKLRQSGEYLLQLINDVLDVNKVESGKIELHQQPCDEERLFDAIIQLVKPMTAQKNITFNFEKINIDWKYMLLDEQRVKQIFINLLTNAVKFTPEGGRIDFIMELVSEDEALIRDKFVIRDNGIGMSEAFLPYLFEPFAQENRNQTGLGGTGLGLSIVKSLVELMGGSITVKSRENEGTEFTLFLNFPLMQGKNVHEVRAEKALPYRLLRGKRVLLCEDHPLNAHIAVRLLEKQGVAVTWKENGRLGLEAFRQSAVGEYDLILMDIRMPEMDGLTAGRAIRDLPRPDAKTVPIIAMTANAYDDDIQKSLDAGMNAHLPKPVEPEKLYDTLALYMSPPAVEAPDHAEGT